MALEKNTIGIVHNMAYPGPRSTKSVLMGEGDERYVLRTIKSIVSDPYFTGIEVTTIKDDCIRKKVADILREGDMEVTYSAQPVQLINEDNLIDPSDISSLDETERINAVERIKECVDEAYEIGAIKLGLVSGRDPGTSAGIGQRRQAMAALSRSLSEICSYAREKAQGLNRDSLMILLEMFDRLDKKNCKNQLIGPTSDAITVAETVKVQYRCDNFGLIYDLSHMPLIKDVGYDSENPQVLKSLAPYLGHIHIGNSVLDEQDDLFGDTHPKMDYSAGAVCRDMLIDFIKVLHEIGYSKGIAFEIMPASDEVAESVIDKAKSMLDEARNDISVNYALGKFFFKPRRFFTEQDFDTITELRVSKSHIIEKEAKERKKRDKITLDGKLTILAADHPGRYVTNVGDDPVGMGDRHDYLARILRVITHPDIDGIMGTPDIIEDLFIVNYMLKEKTGQGFLDNKILLGCMNRAGLAGAAYEMDDRMTAYTAKSMHEMGVDGAKLMFRIDLANKYSIRTLEYCAKAINECNKYGLPVFLEPLPVEKTASGYEIKMNAEDLIKIMGVGSALGDSSKGLWLKIPYVNDYEKVVKATSLPILMLGGQSKGNPITTLENFEKGMGAGRNVRGALVGRNILYPGYDDPRAVGLAVNKIVHEGVSVEDAVKYLGQVRGTDMDFLK